MPGKDAAQAMLYIIVVTVSLSMFSVTAWLCGEAKYWSDRQLSDREDDQGGVVLELVATE